MYVIPGIKSQSNESTDVGCGVFNSDNDVNDVLNVSYTLPTNPSSYDYAHYYSSPISSGYQLIVLDAYRLSLIGCDPQHQSYKDGMTLLTTYNKNDLNGGDWSQGLDHKYRHFVPYNGALGAEQLAWLDKALTALPTKTRAIVTCHISTHKGATGKTTVLWDYQELLEVFRKHKGKVCMYMSGHDHDGGYAYDNKSATHHLTIPAPIESNLGQKAFGVLDFYQNSAQLIGFGKCTSRFMQFE